MLTTDRCFLGAQTSCLQFVVRGACCFTICFYHKAFAERSLLGLALTYAKAGKREQAIRQLEKVIKEFNELQSPRGLPTAIATVYSVLGEKDESFKWVDRSYKGRLGNLLNIRSFPEFDGLRSDPRFEELVRRIGFPS